MTHRHEGEAVLDERAVVAGEGEAAQRGARAGAVHAKGPLGELVAKVHGGWLLWLFLAPPVVVLGGVGGVCVRGWAC